MSKLADKTDRKALASLAKTLRFFDDTADLNMTAIDAFKSREAENIIRSIIENNGYSARYEKGNGTRLTKLKN